MNRVTDDRVDWRVSHVENPFLFVKYVLFAYFYPDFLTCGGTK